MPHANPCYETGKECRMQLKLIRDDLIYGYLYVNNFTQKIKTTFIFF